MKPGSFERILWDRFWHLLSMTVASGVASRIVEQAVARNVLIALCIGTFVGTLLILTALFVFFGGKGEA